MRLVNETYLAKNLSKENFTSVLIMCNAKTPVSAGVEE